MLLFSATLVGAGVQEALGWGVAVTTQDTRHCFIYGFLCDVHVVRIGEKHARKVPDALLLARNRPDIDGIESE
jgi:hypothetical protein